MYSAFRKLALIAVLGTIGCHSAQQTPPSAQAAALEYGNRQSELIPGKGLAIRRTPDPYDGDDQVIGEGQKLYQQFNCAGCHFKGGGGIGPALMDDEWIYGSSSANIYWSIVEGRPNGMPAFGGRVVDDQLRKIVAYVRSLSELQKRERQQKGNLR